MSCKPLIQVRKVRIDTYEGWVPAWESRWSCEAFAHNPILTATGKWFARRAATREHRWAHDEKRGWR